MYNLLESRASYHYKGLKNYQILASIDWIIPPSRFMNPRAERAGFEPTNIVIEHPSPLHLSPIPMEWESNCDKSQWGKYQADWYLQEVEEHIMELTITNNFRIHAVIATFGGFPARIRR